ncbi:MAG: DUF559 domain-containing protein [Candidatus Bathyarchaeota archaeon]|nr:DUF559 domain-containing protein [Candidatus Bathyarchaeota archaeon]
MRCYCSICKETISEQVFEYSKRYYGKPLCIYHQKMARNADKPQPKITPQARSLSEALRKRGIKNKLEDYDGYKHVDISIPWARLNIEIDGRHHLLNPKQLYSDLERDSFSQNDEKSTIRITNDAIERDLDGIADSIAKVARRRYRKDNSVFFP